MSDQDQQREHNRYQEWAAEKDEFESQQYHIYLEEEIKTLKARVAELEQAALMSAAAHPIVQKMQDSLDACNENNRQFAEELRKVEARLAELKGYTHHKVGCKWDSKPVARINEFEVIRQPCSCGLQEALEEVGDG